MSVTTVEAPSGDESGESGETDITVTVTIPDEPAVEEPVVVVVEEPSSDVIEAVLVAEAIDNAGETDAQAARIAALEAELEAVRATAVEALVVAEHAEELAADADVEEPVYVPPAEPVDDSDEQEPDYVHWWHRPMWGGKK